MKRGTLTFPQMSQNNPLLGQVSLKVPPAKGGSVDQLGIGWTYFDMGDAEPRPRTALPNVSVLLFEMFQNKIPAEITVEITPSGMHVVVTGIVELNEVFLGLNPKMPDEFVCSRDVGKGHGTGVFDLFSSFDFLDYVLSLIHI